MNKKRLHFVIAATAGLLMLAYLTALVPPAYAQGACVEACQEDRDDCYDEALQNYGLCLAFYGPCEFSQELYADETNGCEADYRYCALSCLV